MVYFNFETDPGLLCAKKDLAVDDILYMSEELNDFKGGMTENYVNVQLTINGYQTFYWESERPLTQYSADSETRTLYGIR